MSEEKNNEDKTQIYKIKTTQKPKKEKKEKKKKKHGKLKKFLLICFILCILLGLAGVGVFAAIFFSDEWEITKDDLVINHQNTEVYDKDGKKIAELTGDESRKIITLSEMGEYLPNAFVAIEDERYYSHFGIDIKRTAGAIVTYILNGGESSFGGSTITQQLVKNMLEDDASEGMAGVERKIREWSRAYQIEQMLSKSQILELYLNKIFMGSTVYGVESGSQYYFSKPAKKLSLAEAAFLAGINHSPNSYNPFGKEDNSEVIKERTKTVLAKMKDLQNTNVPELQGLTKITDEDYEKAFAEVEKGLKFKKGDTGDNTDISFHTAAALNQVIAQYAKEKDLKFEAASDIIKNSGYKLYTTQDSSIQKIMEKEYKKDKYIHEASVKGKHSQSAMTVIDYKTGYVVGCVGGLGEDSTAIGQNRATQSDNLQAGSAMKPLAAIAPGLEERVITAATIYDDDSNTSFGGESYNNSTGDHGLISVRAAITCSSNIVNMKILSNVGPYTSIGYLNDFGLTQYTDEDASLTLTLGGTVHGASPTQMAAAYGALANGGVYVEPTFYLKLEDSKGETVLEPTQETRRVVSEQTAYITTNILKSPVEGFGGVHATATNCKIAGMETAAKTGTTSSFKDRWLCGMTPYYSAATWYGYDDPEEIVETVDGYENPSSVIWKSVMSQIHEDLAPADFKQPSGIVYAKICSKTGRVATKDCKDTYTEIFATGTVPGECQGHQKIKICKETKLLATEFCPNTEEIEYDIKPEKEQNPTWNTPTKNKYKEIKDTCKKHTAETMSTKVPNVLGLTEEAAKATLADFNVSVIYEADLSQPEGTVIRQSVDPETSLPKGSSITITVNPITTPPENPENPGEGEGNEIGGEGENPGEGNTEPGGNTTDTPDTPENII